MISDSKREEIQKGAKKILDDFAKALEKVKVKEKRLKRDVGGFRKEESGKIGDSSFREIMFANAPFVEGDSIVAEKKKW